MDKEYPIYRLPTFLKAAREYPAHLSTIKSAVIKVVGFCVREVGYAKDA